MTQQMSAGRPFIGGRGFSSASAMGGLGGHRTYVASVGHPIGNGYGVRCFSSQSLSNLGGSRRISHGGYGGYGAGYYGGYDAYGYGHMGYGTLGFGGRMGHTGNGGLLGGYSNFRGDGIRGVTINENLLKPLHVGVDPQEHEARNQEREEMKTLNDQFACFIDKVRYLEQQNKVLETKWKLLQECAIPAKKNLEPYYENFLSNMKKQHDFLLHEREQLTHEEASIKQLVEEFKSGYEEELKRRTAAENEFVLLKKDVDCIFLSKEELEGKVDLLSRELEFRRHVHAEEVAQLDCQVYDTNILLQMDNSRNLDVDQIIKNVEAWYQSVAHRSKEEVNALYENRFLELQEQRGKYSDNLKINQHQITELTRLLHKLQSEHDAVKKQVDCLQSSICDVEQRGDVALKDARDKHSELQTAVQKAKDDLARLLKDYHELLNTKLALDIEIATYKTMLEGEESRISKGNFVSIDVVNSPYIEESLGYLAPCGYGPISVGYGSYGAEFCGRYGRRRSYSGRCGGGYRGEYSGGYSGRQVGGDNEGYGRRRSWSGACGGGHGGSSGGGYSGGGYGGSSGGGYSGGGYGGSSGGGYSGGGYGGNSGGGYCGGGYGGSSGGGYSGGGYGGENSGGRRDWSARSSECHPRTVESSRSRGQPSGDAGSSGRGYGSRNASDSSGRQNTPVGIESSAGCGGRYSSGSAQGPVTNTGTQRGSMSGRGWTSDCYPPTGGIQYGGGVYVPPKIVGGPVIVGGGPGVDVGCVPVGIPTVGVPAVGIGGIGIRKDPYVEVGSPVGVCYPGPPVGSPQRQPIAVCYPGPV